MPNAPEPIVGVIMGSKSDWPDFMEHASRTLSGLGVPHEKRVLSAHRTPDALAEYAAAAFARGIRAIISGAGGAAHQPGMAAAKCIIPVVGVPREADATPSIQLMPKGVPVATMAPGKVGAINAALYVAQQLAMHDPVLYQKIVDMRAKMAEAVEEDDHEIVAK